MLSQHGDHNIEDELVFSNHNGYVFHDSRGIESGSKEELATLQEFIQRKAGAGRIENRLHAIWFELQVASALPILAADGNNLFRYCVAMDNHRPNLDLKYFKDICPDQNGMS